MSKRVTHCFVDLRLNAGGKDAWLCPCATYTLDPDGRFADLLSVDVMARDKANSVVTIDITSILPTMILEDIASQASARQDQRLALDGKE